MAVNRAAGAHARDSSEPAAESFRLCRRGRCSLCMQSPSSRPNPPSACNAGLLDPQVVGYHRHSGTWVADKSFMAGRLHTAWEVQDALAGLIDER